MNKAIFIDKDGTLIKDVPYNTKPEKIRFTPGVLSGLKQLQREGFFIVIVTNQSGVARGFCTEEEVQNVGAYLDAYFRRHGIALNGYYYCPHFPGSVTAFRNNPYILDCFCRKPRPGMFYQAASELNISLQDSWMIGDILDDVEAGRNAGCKSIFFDVGNETEWKLSDKRIPNYITTDFYSAVDFICCAELPSVSLTSNDEIRSVN